MYDYLYQIYKIVQKPYSQTDELELWTMQKKTFFGSHTIIIKLHVFSPCGGGGGGYNQFEVQGRPTTLRATY